MSRGVLYGMVCGLAVSVGCYAASIYNSPLLPVFCILSFPGAIIDDFLRGPPMRPHGPSLFIAGSVACYALAGAVAQRLLERIIYRPRPKRGLCQTCGYDLTGNVSGVCPECGVEVDRP